jgi:excinuclease ABC subunit A
MENLMTEEKKLIIRGARVHNLKNINVELPRDKLIVITGLSGSGKSSLAFDTIYAEGQRRYVESLSAYARQFLGQMDKPDVDQIEGLSPAISIDQKGASRNPRSTVGTITEIYDYLRLLFARIGIPHCPNCGREANQQTAQQIIDAIQEKPAGSRLLILAPLIKDRKGEHKSILEDIRKLGFVRVRVDGRVHDVEEEQELDRYKMHTIEAVVDRLIIKPQDQMEAADHSRLADSVETALKLGNGVLLVADITDSDNPIDKTYSENFACVYCGINLPEIEPRTFSFNSPHGACPVCTGLGNQLEIDPDLIFAEPELSLEGGAIKPWSRNIHNGYDGYYQQLIQAVAHHYNIPMNVPVKDLSIKQKDILLYGSRPGDRINIHYHNNEGHERFFESTFEGVINNLERRFKESSSDYVRSEIERYMTIRPCPACKGKRLRPEALSVTIDGKSIDLVTAMSVKDSLLWIKRLQGEGTDSILSHRENLISHQIFKEINSRLNFMANVGLNYLALERAAATLSGGEAQRIRLATQIGSQLMGCLYILDEPSIGLHQKDNEKLITTLKQMRDLGNTIIVVEHDEDTMLAADWILDLGPGAGEKGGYVVCSAPTKEFLKCPDSLTAKYLRGEEFIPIPATRHSGNNKELAVIGASENNLKNISVKFPLGRFVCVTGVSGSGKSSLVIDILYKKLAQMIYRTKDKPGAHLRIEGGENLDKIVDIDQSPIGRTPRSNPATYTGLFGPIRDLFAGLPESKLRGYTPGRFSFNVKGGRCEACQGDGIIQIAMQFLPDVYVPCEVCHGLRYNRETLQIHYKGKNIADVLDMTVEEGLEFFANIPSIRNKLETLMDVGLGYVRLGQSATTLSGGEAQRIKLSKELSRRATGKTLYILDEPTTGLHFDDIKKLLAVLSRLVDSGNSVIVIEHNLDVIKTADWIIDLGPDGGENGGRLVAAGTPEEISLNPASYTGQWLKRALAPAHESAS